MKPRIIIIGGPTCSGKSELAIRLSERLNGEIVCADSLTVYKGFNIGSAKPSEAQRRHIPHHLLDIRNPSEPFTAADFGDEAAKAISDISARGRTPVIAGGTGLYLRILIGGLNNAPGEDRELRESLRKRGEEFGGDALLEELRAVDPATAKRCHPKNLVRIIRALEVWHSTGRRLSEFHEQHRFNDEPYEHLFLCLQQEREELYRRIETRVDNMISDGLIDEVRGLLDAGAPENSKPMQSIGYKETLVHLKGEMSLKEMADMIKLNTRHLAKRQITWFRRESAARNVAYPEFSDSIETIAETFLKEGDISK